MKRIAIVVMFGSALIATGQAEARGCIRGAIVGGIAGHYAGHHAILGAIAGCAVGRHMANRKPEPVRAPGGPMQPAH